MRKNICRTVISSKEQNLNKQMAEFRISILFQYSMYILAKFNIFSWSWKLISKLNTFNTAWELCDTFTTAAYWNTFARCRQDKAHDNNYTGKSIENTVKMRCITERKQLPGKKAILSRIYIMRISARINLHCIYSNNLNANSKKRKLGVQLHYNWFSNFLWSVTNVICSTHLCFLLLALYSCLFSLGSSVLF